MKRLALVLGGFLLVAGLWYLFASAIRSKFFGPTESVIEVGVERVGGEGDGEMVEVVLGGLEIPWEIGFLPDGRILVTERQGRLLRNKELRIFQPQVCFQSGLLSVTLNRF